MATIATETVATAGLNATYSAAAASHRFAAGSLVHVKNANAGACIVTQVTPAVIDGNAIADKAVTVPAAGERFIWVSTDPTYRDPADGLVELQFSVTASVTCASVKPTAMN